MTQTIHVQVTQGFTFHGWLLNPKMSSLLPEVKDLMWHNYLEAAHESVLILSYRSKSLQKKFSFYNR